MDTRQLKTRLIIDYIGIAIAIIGFLGLLIYGIIVGEPNKCDCQCVEEEKGLPE